MRAAFEQFGPPMENWWADFGTPRLDGDAIETMSRAVDDMLEGQSIPALAVERDARLLALLAALEAPSSAERRELREPAGAGARLQPSSRRQQRAPGRGA